MIYVVQHLFVSFKGNKIKALAQICFQCEHNI